MNGKIRGLLGGYLGLVCSSLGAAEPAPDSVRPRAANANSPSSTAPSRPAPARLHLDSPRADKPKPTTQLSEKRKQLSDEAAITGNDPTAIVGFYQARYGYSAFDRGATADSVESTVRLPLTPNWFVQATLPYQWADLNRPAAGFSANGTANLVFRTGGRLYSNEFVHVLLGLDTIFPTASDPRLGTAHYTLGPGVALAAPMPRLNTLAFLVASDYHSVGGAVNAADVHFMQIEPRLNTYWSEHWWTLLDGQWSVDWQNRRTTTLNLFGVLGYRVDEHWNIFGGVGGGVVGQATFLGLDWGVQAGVRWVFDTPLIPETFFSTPFGDPG